MKNTLDSLSCQLTGDLTNPILLQWIVEVKFKEDDMIGASKWKGLEKTVEEILEISCCYIYFTIVFLAAGIQNKPRQKKDCTCYYFVERVDYIYEVN